MRGAPARPLEGRAREAGFATIEHVAVVGLSMVLCVLLANFIVFQYGRGVVRAALDEGVRAGAREAQEGSPGRGAELCRARAEEVRASLLGGPMGDGVRIACWEDSEAVRAHASVRFAGWVPVVLREYRFESRARAGRLHP